MRDLLDRLDGWRDEQVEFLARLVNHDSGTDDVLDVNRVGAILAERLEGLGFNLRRVATERFGDHLVGEKPGAGPKRFLFVGHYDTVFPSGTAKQRPFRIDEQGRAWGPGVYDMKGGLVALLYALRAHREARTRAWAETTVAVVFNSDEERLSPTSRPVIEAEARRAHSVGILEPARPGGEYVMARKGAGTFHLEVTGKASHAGLQPELGASAIWDLAQKVAALHALTDFATGVTVNVGTVRGGELPNVVAARAAAEIDLRAWSPADADAAIAAWDAKFENHFWRPIGAIQGDRLDGTKGHDDGNPTTVEDVSWTPLGAPGNLPGEITDDFTPPFPAWTSGHGTMGSAIFQTLANFFGNDFAAADAAHGADPVPPHQQRE